MAIEAPATVLELPRSAERCLHRNPPATPSGFYRTRLPLLIVVGVLFAFFAIAASIASGWLLLHWDEPIQRWVESQRTDDLDTFFRQVSGLASTRYVLVLAPLLAVLAWPRCRAVAFAVAVAAIARPLLEFTLKEV